MGQSLVGEKSGIQITTVCVSGLCRADLEAHMAPLLGVAGVSGSAGESSDILSVRRVCCD